MVASPAAVGGHGCRQVRRMPLPRQREPEGAISHAAHAHRPGVPVIDPPACMGELRITQCILPHRRRRAIRAASRAVLYFA
jgi:hypothetical protein